MTTIAAGNLKTIINIWKPEAEQPEFGKIDTVKIIGEFMMVLCVQEVVNFYIIFYIIAYSSVQ